MSSRMSRYGTGAAVLAIIATIILFSWLTVEVTFPNFRYASGSMRRQLVPADPYDSIAGGVSRFLWDHRALDLTGQAFVIVAAVICCLAMLKPSEEES